MDIKKYIFVKNFKGILKSLVDGHYIKGSLYIDKETHVLTFKPYNCSPRQRLKDLLIRPLEHGWVKESPDCIKLYQSVPKILGTARILGVLDRETKEAKNALMEREIIDRV
jgi:hypothetical protein